MHNDCEWVGKSDMHVSVQLAGRGRLYMQFRLLPSQEHKFDHSRQMPEYAARIPIG
jgi:hypothetical protein